MVTLQAAPDDSGTWLKQNAHRANHTAGAMGAMSGGAHVVEAEMEPEAFTYIYRVCREKTKDGRWIVPNRRIKVRVLELHQGAAYLTKLVNTPGHPDFGKPVFSREPLKQSPAAAGVVAEVAPDNGAKGHRRRRRRRGRRG